MPSEIRYIVFALTEIDALLRQGIRRLRRSCPRGRLSCIAERREHFSFMFDSGQIARLTPEEVFACTLWYCQERGVPISRHFEKRLEFVDGKLVLVSGDLARARPAFEAVDVGEPVGEAQAPAACALCGGEPGACVLDQLGAKDEEPYLVRQTA